MNSKLFSKQISKNSNKNYIFTFGKAGVGKSTMIASIAKAIEMDDELLLIPNIKNKKGYGFLYEQWIEKIEEKKFPMRSLRKKIIEIDIGIQKMESKEGERNGFGITFYEMSGEDLEDIKIKYKPDGLHAENKSTMFGGDDEENDEDSHEKFKKEFETYIKQSNLCLLVTDIKEAKKDDKLIYLFLLVLEEMEINIPTALIITKWDDLEDKNITLEEFVLKNLRSTSKWLTARINERDVFQFSVGKVEKGEDNMPYIKEFNTNHAINLISWISEVLPQ